MPIFPHISDGIPIVPCPPDICAVNPFLCKMQRDVEYEDEDDLSESDFLKPPLDPWRMRYLLNPDIEQDLRPLGYDNPYPYFSRFETPSFTYSSSRSPSPPTMSLKEQRAYMNTGIPSPMKFQELANGSIGSQGIDLVMKRPAEQLSKNNLLLMRQSRAYSLIERDRSSPFDPKEKYLELKAESPSISEIPTEALNSTPRRSVRSRINTSEEKQLRPSKMSFGTDREMTYTGPSDEMPLPPRKSVCAERAKALTLPDDVSLSAPSPKKSICTGVRTITLPDEVPLSAPTPKTSVCDERERTFLLPNDVPLSAPTPKKSVCNGRERKLIVPDEVPLSAPTPLKSVCTGRERTFFLPNEVPLSAPTPKKSICTARERTLVSPDKVSISAPSARKSVCSERVRTLTSPADTPSSPSYQKKSVCAERTRALTSPDKIPLATQSPTECICLERTRTIMAPDETPAPLSYRNKSVCAEGARTLTGPEEMQSSAPSPRKCVDSERARTLTLPVNMPSPTYQKKSVCAERTNALPDETQMPAPYQRKSVCAERTITSTGPDEEPLSAPFLKKSVCAERTRTLKVKDETSSPVTYQKKSVSTDREQTLTIPEVSPFITSDQGKSVCAERTRALMNPEEMSSSAPSPKKGVCAERTRALINPEEMSSSAPFSKKSVCTDRAKTLNPDEYTSATQGPLPTRGPCTDRAQNRLERQTAQQSQGDKLADAQTSTSSLNVCRDFTSDELPERVMMSRKSVCTEKATTATPADEFELRPTEITNPRNRVSEERTITLFKETESALRSCSSEHIQNRLYRAQNQMATSYFKQENTSDCVCTPYSIPRPQISDKCMCLSCQEKKDVDKMYQDLCIQTELPSAVCVCNKGNQIPAKHSCPCDVLYEDQDEYGCECSEITLGERVITGDKSIQNCNQVETAVPWVSRKKVGPFVEKNPNLVGLESCPSEVFVESLNQYNQLQPHLSSKWEAIKDDSCKCNIKDQQIQFVKVESLVLQNGDKTKKYSKNILSRGECNTSMGRQIVSPADIENQEYKKPISKAQETNIPINWQYNSLYKINWYPIDENWNRSKNVVIVKNAETKTVFNAGYRLTKARSKNLTYPCKTSIGIPAIKGAKQGKGKKPNNR